MYGVIRQRWAKIALFCRKFLLFDRIDLSTKVFGFHTVTKDKASPMKAMLYMPKIKDPVAVLDSVQIVKMNDNHKAAPYRIFFKSARLNAGRTMVELHRDEKMSLQLEDGRACHVLLQHSSIDSKGNAVGVLRVLDGLDG
jgi:hypothetical protein